MTSLSPGLGEKMSKRSVRGGDANGLLALLDELKRKARARSGVDYPIICIQEAGLDGFWLHRVLEDAGVESHVVDAASIAAPRRKRGSRPTGSTARRCCARCWRSSAASRGSARWRRRRASRRRTCAGRAGSGRRCSPSGGSTSTGSRGCCSRKGSAIMSRCAAIAAAGCRSCATGRAQAAAASSGADRARAGAAGTAARPDRGGRARTRCAAGAGGEGRGRAGAGAASLPRRSSNRRPQRRPKRLMRHRRRLMRDRRRPRRSRRRRPQRRRRLPPRKRPRRWRCCWV